MNFNIKRILLPILPLVLFVAGCETTEYEPNLRGETTVAFQNPYGTEASKALETTLEDANGGLWSLQFNGTESAGNLTTFSYTLTKPAEGGGNHLSYRLPDCVFEEGYSFVEASPQPTINQNANEFLEWSPFNGSTVELSIVFEGNNVPVGVTAWGLKSQGDGGEIVRLGEVAGPCQPGRYIISGTVFLNDNSADLDGGAANDTFEEAVEPGVANVEVQLWESEDGSSYTFDATSGIQLTSDQPDTYGQYSFEVLADPFEPAPDFYKVVIAKSAVTADGINDALFDDSGLFEVTTGPNSPTVDDPLVGVAGGEITKDVDLNNPSGINFGFELNVRRGIELFEAGDLVSDGHEREYWLVQLRQRGSKKYGPEFGAEQVESLLNCSLSGYDPTPNAEPDFKCIRDPLNLEEDFGGDVDDLIDTIFNIDGVDDLGEGVEILKTDSNNDEQEGLRTQLLAALLNFTTGRGPCVDQGGPPEADLNADGRCVEFDPATMRASLQHGLVVLANSGYVGKASDGSVSLTRDYIGGLN